MPLLSTANTPFYHYPFKIAGFSTICHSPHFTIVTIPFQSFSTFSRCYSRHMQGKTFFCMQTIYITINKTNFYAFQHSTTSYFVCAKAAKVQDSQSDKVVSPVFNSNRGFLLIHKYKPVHVHVYNKSFNRKPL